MDVYMVAATQVFHFYRCKCSERGEQDAFLVALTKGTHTLVSSKGQSGGAAFCSLNKVSKLRQEYTTHTVGPSSWGPRTPKNKPFRRSFTYTDIIAGDIPYKPTESQPKALLKDTDSTAVRFESQLMVPPEKRQHDRRVLFPSLCCVERCAWWNSPSPFPSEKPLLKLFKRSFNVLSSEPRISLPPCHRTHPLYPEVTPNPAKVNILLSKGQQERCQMPRTQQWDRGAMRGFYFSFLEESPCCFPQGT